MVQVLCVLGSVIVGSAGIVVGGFIILLGIAVDGCPPDADECPF